MPHKPYFAVMLLGMSSCASYVSRTHGVIDVTRSQSRSNFEIDISLSIFELERRKAQNIWNANGYLSGIFNFRYNFRWKSLSRAQDGGHFENFELLNTASIWPQIWKVRSKLCQKKVFFMMMTSSMTSKGSLKVGPLYSFINEITTFFMITRKRAKISPLNFLRISIMTLWLNLYRYIFMTSLMTSPGHQVRSNFEIDISPSIFELERRSKAQNIGNAIIRLSFGYIQLPV